jgi:hypothetical protein
MEVWRMPDNLNPVDRADTEADDMDGWDWMPACVVHLRFPPCRREGPCNLWNTDDARRIVGAYQQSQISEAEARYQLAHIDGSIRPEGV